VRGIRIGRSSIRRAAGKPAGRAWNRRSVLHSVRFEIGIREHIRGAGGCGHKSERGQACQAMDEVGWIHIGLIGRSFVSAETFVILAGSRNAPSSPIG
jgi:hypothetical protein